MLVLTALAAVAAAHLVAALELTSVVPHDGPATGAVIVTLEGSGFGVTSPPDDDPDALAATIGGTPCRTTTWVSDAVVECELPPGSGQQLDVAVEVNGSVARLKRYFNYAPAVLHGVAAASPQAAGSGALPHAERAVSPGSPVVLVGSNFVSSTGMQCRFGGSQVVQATFLNSTHVECITPLSARGTGSPVPFEDGGADDGQSSDDDAELITVEVTNDGKRWSPGCELDLSAVQWHGGLPGEAVPPDFPPSSAPAELSLVFTSGANAAFNHAFEAAVASVNANARLLPHTTFTYEVLDSDVVANHGPEYDSREAAAAAAVADVRARLPHVVAVIGDDSSSISIPLSLAGHPRRVGDDGAIAPWAQVSYASTSPDLSNITKYPNFLRVVPSDVFQGAALVSVVRFFGKALLARQLLDGRTRAVGCVYIPDEAYSAGIAQVFLAEAAAQGLVVDPVITMTEADYMAAADDDARAALVDAVLQPLGERVDVRTIVMTVHMRVSVDLVQGVLRLPGDHLMVGPDSFTIVNALLLKTNASCLVIAPSAGTGAAALASIAHTQSEIGETGGFVPFVWDSVDAVARALHTRIASTLDPDPASYYGVAGIEALVSTMREMAPNPDSLSGFGGFVPGSNDPRRFSFSLDNWFGGTSVPIGLATADSVVLDASKPVRFPSGSDFDFEAPTTIVIAVALRLQFEILWQQLTGLEAAVQAVNESPLVLPNTRVELHVLDMDSIAQATNDDAIGTQLTQAGAEAVVAAALDARAAAGDGVALPVLFGSIPSSETALLVAAAAEEALPLVSAGSTSDALSSAAAFPLFARSVAADPLQAEAMIDLITRMGWRRIATIRSTLMADDGSGVGSVCGGSSGIGTDTAGGVSAEPATLANALYSERLESNILSAAAGRGVEVVHRVALCAEHGEAEVAARLRTARDESGARVFVVATSTTYACAVMVAAGRPDTAMTDGTVAFVGGDGWITHRLCDGALGTGLPGGEAMSDEATTAANEAAAGAIGTQPTRGIAIGEGAHAGAIGDMAVQSVTNVSRAVGGSGVVRGVAPLLDAVDAWRSRSDEVRALQAAAPGGVVTAAQVLAALRSNASDASLPTWLAASSFDAVFAVADTVERMLLENQDVEDGVSFMRYLRAASVIGVTGPLAFTAGTNDRAAAGYDIANRHVGGDDPHQLVGRATDRGFLIFTGCPPGHTALLVAATRVCTPCPANTYKPSSGDGACTPCAGSTSTSISGGGGGGGGGSSQSSGLDQMVTGGVLGATSAAQCLCPAGLVAAYPGSPAYVARSSANYARAFRCEPCPENGVCDGVGLSLAGVKNRIGYWRGHPNSTEFVPCFEKENCGVSGIPVLSADIVQKYGAQPLPNEWGSPCSEGHHGPLCAVCLPGWGRVGNTHICSKCSGSGSSIASVLFMTAGSIALVLFLTYWQFSASSLSPYAMRRTGNVKVFLSWLQFTSFLRLFNLSWSSPMLELFGVQKAVLTSPITFVAMECLVDNSHNVLYSSFVLHMAVPVVVVAGAGLALAVAQGVDSWRLRRLRAVLGTAEKRGASGRRRRGSNARVPSAHAGVPTPMGTRRALEEGPSERTLKFMGADSRGGGGSDGEHHDGLATFGSTSARVHPVSTPARGSPGTSPAPTAGRATAAATAVSKAATGDSAPRLFDVEWMVDFFVALLTVVLFLAYPYEVNSVFSLLDCTDVGGASYLRDDMSVDCNSSTYKAYATAAGVAFVVYGIGIPVLTGTLLAQSYRWLFMLSVDTTVPAGRKMRSSDSWHLRRIMDHVAGNMHWSLTEASPALLSRVSSRHSGSSPRSKQGSQRSLVAHVRAAKADAAVAALVAVDDIFGGASAAEVEGKEDPGELGAAVVADASTGGGDAKTGARSTDAAPAAETPDAKARAVSAGSGAGGNGTGSGASTADAIATPGGRAQRLRNHRSSRHKETSHVLSGVNPVRAIVRGVGFLIGTHTVPTTRQVQQRLIGQELHGKPNGGGSGGSFRARTGAGSAAAAGAGGHAGAGGKANVTGSRVAAANQAWFGADRATGHVASSPRAASTDGGARALSPSARHQVQRSRRGSDHSIRPGHAGTSTRINRLLHSLTYKVNAARSAKLVRLRARFDLVHRALVLDFFARVAHTLDCKRTLAAIDRSEDTEAGKELRAFARVKAEAELDARAAKALDGLSVGTRLMLRLFVPTHDRNGGAARRRDARSTASAADDAVAAATTAAAMHAGSVQAGSRREERPSSLPPLHGVGSPAGSAAVLRPVATSFAPEDASRAARPVLATAHSAGATLNKTAPARAPPPRHERHSRLGEQAWPDLLDPRNAARALERARVTAEAEGLGAKLLDNDQWRDALLRMRMGDTYIRRTRTLAGQALQAALAGDHKESASAVGAAKVAGSMRDVDAFQRQQQREAEEADDDDVPESESIEATVRRLQIAAASTRQVTTPADLNRCLELIERSFSDGAARIVMDPRISVDEVMWDVSERLHLVNRATRRLGFVYDAYRPGSEFYSLVDMVKKLALIATAIFLTSHGPLIQGTCAMLIVFLAIVRSFSLHPYLRVSALDVPLQYEPRVMRIIKRAFDMFLNSRRLLWDAGLPSDVQLHETEHSRDGLPLLERLPEEWDAGRLDKLALGATFISLVVGMLSTAMAQSGFSSEFAAGTHDGSGSLADATTLADVFVLCLRATVFLVNCWVMILFGVIIGMDTWMEYRETLRRWFGCCGRDVAAGGA